MGYGLSGSGAGVLRVTGNQTVSGPLTFLSGIVAYMNGTTPAIETHGANLVGQLEIAYDFFGNPIKATNTDGLSIGGFGDRVAAYPPGDVFNTAFATLTNSADNVVNDAGVVRLGHGTSFGAVFAIGTGLPGAANPITTGVPPNGSVYFRTDGGAGTTLYHVEAGAWVARA